MVQRKSVKIKYFYINYKLRNETKLRATYFATAKYLYLNFIFFSYKKVINFLFFYDEKNYRYFIFSKIYSLSPADLTLPSG